MPLYLDKNENPFQTPKEIRDAVAEERFSLGLTGTLIRGTLF